MPDVVTTQRYNVVESGAAVGAAVASGGVIPIVLAVATAMNDLEGLFKGKKLQWADANKWIGSVVPTIVAKINSQYSATEVEKIRVKLYELYPAFVNNSNVQSPGIKSAFLKAPEHRSDMDIAGLLWLGLHFEWAGAPEINSYEVERRLKDFNVGWIEPALGQSNAVARTGVDSFVGPLAASFGLSTETLYIAAGAVLLLLFIVL